MQFTKVAILLACVMGAVATGVESESNSIDARGEGGAHIIYEGKCTRKDNNCKFKVDGKTNFKKCGKAANKKCTNDGKKCRYDSYNGNIDCD